MKLLIDSHTLIWAADDPAKLGARAQSLIHDPANDRLLSAATLWGIAIKFGLGRLPLSLPYRQWMDRAMADLVLVVLPRLCRPGFGYFSLIDLEVRLSASGLPPGPHRGF